jgi:hypothetical protein
MIKALSFLFSLLPMVALAQDGTRIGGPVSGTVFDRNSAALRPMLGVPGASYLGPGLVAGITVAAVSPDGSCALTVSEGRLQWVSGLREMAPASMPVDGALEGVDRLAWSPDGAFAAVYSSRSGQVQVLRDASRAPAAGPAIDVAPGIMALAVSASGDLLAGAEGGVYLVAAGSAPRLLAAATRPASMVTRGSAVYVADSGAGSVLLVENFATAAAASVFADGVPSPVGVEISADGRRLFVASREGKFVGAWDLASRSSAGRVELECTPTELSAFGGRDIWLLNSDSGGPDPLYVATGGVEPAAWFVPAGREQ